MDKVLICDDEKKIRETMCDFLTAKGFDVTLASNGSEAVLAVDNAQFDVIILDVMMPVMDGLEACRRIRRKTDTPIIFLSALGEENDLIDGYRQGADDYIVKPFPLAVLCEKCRSVIARYKGTFAAEELSFFGITVNRSKMQVAVDSQEIVLQKKTYQLLVLLMENKEIVLSREQILTRIWGWDFDGDERVVDTHIKNLRKALGEKSKHVKTVIGGGYSFREV